MYPFGYNLRLILNKSAGFFLWKSAGRISGKSQFRRNQTPMTPGPAAADGGKKNVVVVRVRRGGRYQ